MEAEKGLEVLSALEDRTSPSREDELDVEVEGAVPGAKMVLMRLERGEFAGLAKPREFLVPEGAAVRVRPLTIHPSRIARRRLEVLGSQFPRTTERQPQKPQTTEECNELQLGSPDRPCPFVSCPNHLYLDVDPDSGAIKFNFPNMEPDELQYTCSHWLERNKPGMTLEDVAEVMNLTRERIRQLEQRGLRKLRRFAAKIEPERERGKKSVSSSAVGAQR